jgi:hypothetical protein
MVHERLLESDPAVVDLAIGFRADPLDLILVPRIDETHILVGVFAELCGLGRRPDMDLLDLGRLLVTRTGVDSLTRSVRDDLHRASHLGLEREERGRPANGRWGGVFGKRRIPRRRRPDRRGGLDGDARRDDGTFLKVRVHSNYPQRGPKVLPERVDDNRDGTIPVPTGTGQIPNTRSARDGSLRQIAASPWILKGVPDQLEWRHYVGGGH